MRKTLFLFMIVILFSPTITLAENQDYIPLNSESVILIDPTTGEVLYDKYSNHQMYPASITKIVTAIIAIETGDLNEIVTVSEKARHVAGTRVYLKAGEKVTLKKLIQGLMINSGNDAGVAIAEHIDGSVKAFAKRMNRFVEEKIGVENTHFVNPHGLFDPNHITTAEDMAKITQYAMNNPTFREIVSTKQLKWNGEAWDTTLYNHHRLLRQREDVTGVKNGYVAPAGFTLVTTASRDHIDLLTVTLKADSADQAYNDTEKLLEYGFENYQTYTVKPDEPFINSKGEEYILEKNYSFTAPREIVWSIRVDNNGKLLIVNSNGQILAEHQLTPLKTIQASAVASAKSELEPEPKQFNFWWVGIISVLLIKTAILFMIKFKRKKRRFFY